MVLWLVIKNNYLTEGGKCFGKKDMALLIEVEDELHNMDQALEQLTGHGHANGDFIKLDNVFDVIFHNSHEYYTGQSEEIGQLFFQILMIGKSGITVRGSSAGT